MFLWYNASEPNIVYIRECEVSWSIRVSKALVGPYTHSDCTSKVQTDPSRTWDQILSSF